MSAAPPRLSDYLTHIRDAIERIDRYAATTDETGFIKNELIQDAVLRNFEIIGEASSRIEKQYSVFATTHPELPLAAAYQMRNAIVHGYFKIDFVLVWRTIQNDLPTMLQRVVQLLDEDVD